MLAIFGHYVYNLLDLLSGTGNVDAACFTRLILTAHRFRRLKRLTYTQYNRERFLFSRVLHTVVRCRRASPESPPIEHAGRTGPEGGPLSLRIPPFPRRGMFGEMKHTRSLTLSINSSQRYPRCITHASRLTRRVGALYI